MSMSRANQHSAPALYSMNACAIAEFNTFGVAAAFVVDGNKSKKMYSGI